MLGLADPAQAYRRVDFEAHVAGLAGPDLVRLCFEDLESALDRALWAHGQQRPDIRRKALERAQLGLTVLLSGLDRDNPVSQPLDTFYRSMILRLTGSLRQFDARAIAGVRADISDIARSFFG
ncbi:MAG: flagellar protein FliS [Erythrobacter sp.]|nr:flagellar protein FliS [Erythrobacter sp.]